jgi:hypothetical protein
MGYRLREIEAERNFCSTLSFDAFARVVPPELITAVLDAEQAQATRKRKLNMFVVIMLVIALHLYPDRAVGAVFQKLAQGLRFIWPDPDYEVPGDSALSYRRYQLGARPLVALFQQVCQPRATPATRGAFLFGLRLMAIDGAVDDVPDTPANAAAFGRHISDRGASAFPQVQCVYLAECGTHAIVDAGFWPCHTSERVGGFRMLRSVAAGMLVMWDRGFHDYDMFLGVVQRDAHVLARLPAHVQPERVRSLPDGTSLASLAPSAYGRRKHGERLLVRVISYTITDPQRPGYGEVHRLVTTLLDPDLYPALDVVCAYHERWEIELVIDELQTHQRLAGRTLRSRKPVGVIQELYALLLAHYIIRYLMYEAAVQVDLDPDRLSFVGALRVLQDAVAEFQMVAPEQRARLYQRLLRDIARHRLPERCPRSNPRVVKRKMSKFKLKRSEHAHRPQLERPFREVIALHPAPPADSMPGRPSAGDRLLLELPPRGMPGDQAYIELRQLEPCRI